MTSSLFERLKTGLEEGIAHAEGRLELRTTTIVLRAIGEKRRIIRKTQVMSGEDEGGPFAST